MSDCKTYPADTVDIYGNVWPTVGENIRNGIFGENVKVGYVNINKGNVTSQDFIVSVVDSTSFKIDNIHIFFAFTDEIKEGGLNISFNNSSKKASISNTTPLSNVIGTIKIIYKENW